MIDHEDQQVVTVQRWAMLECGGNARDAMVLAQISWWFQPALRDGTPRTSHTVERFGQLWMYVNDADLAEQLGMSDSQVRHARTSLKDRGLLDYRASKVNGAKVVLVRPMFAGNGDSAVYVEKASSETAIPPNSQTAIPPNPLYGDLAESHARAIPSREPRLEDREDGRLRGFDEFWAVYPARVGRGMAKAKWLTALRSAGSPEVIVAGAIRYRDNPQRTPRYTKNPSTWLEGECWSDEPVVGLQASQSTRSILGWVATKETPRKAIG